MRKWVYALLILMLAVSTASAQPFTRRSSQVKYDDLKQYYEITNFRIGGKYDLDDPSKWQDGGVGGTTLESLGGGKLRTAYIALGTPRRNAAGEIINAVVVNSFYSGDATDMYIQWVVGTPLSGGPVIGPGKLIDTNKYYVVLCDALGLWGTSKPSDGLGQKFPQYSYMDMVQANYRMLREHLKVGHIALVTGASMGATQTYVWGVMYPGFITGLMPVGGTTQSDGADPVGNWTFQLMTAAIESDPVWRSTGGNYYNLPKEQHPNQGVAFGWSVLSMTGFDFDFRSSQDWAAVQPDVFYWTPPTPKAGSNMAARALLFDAVDLIYRNRAGETYNINNDLRRIRARTLVMHIENDNWLNFSRAKRAVELTPGADLLSETSPVAHYGVFSIVNHKASDPKLVSFLTDISRQTDPSFLVAKNYVTPGVAEKIDPNKSFWQNAMTYPFPVKYSDAKDKKGNVWKIGYMDEYYGSDPNPQVLVIIHGKGAFAGHYGNVMKLALERGLRVIAPDLPMYGMSGPGNLDKNMARTMQDMREVMNDLIVRQLGVQKAAYMGHSLGGQIVMGYALTWPDAVSSLVLEAPAGLEEYPREIALGPDKKVALFDASLAGNWDKWRSVWDQTGILDSEINRSEQSIRDFFNFKKRDPVTGAQIPSNTGYFLRDSEYARLHTEQRVGLTKGPRKELEQWANVFIYDVYGIVSELQQDDPNSLYKREIQLKMPIFLSFGDKEPFIPGTAFNGLKDLGADIITPFMSRMIIAGNRPVLKIYPDTGHFIHTDNPVEFATDVVDFVQTGRVDSLSPVAVDRLINGAPALPGSAAPSANSSPTAGLNK